MKYVVLGLVAVMTTYSSAEAKGGKMPVPPVPYDYSKENKKDYKKDYCLDSIGNHIYCSSEKLSSK